jgi:hypothetical protein
MGKWFTLIRKRLVLVKKSTLDKNLTVIKHGKGGIRTPGDRKATPIFKIGAINHSATFPINIVILF